MSGEEKKGPVVPAKRDPAKLELKEPTRPAPKAAVKPEPREPEEPEPAPKKIPLHEKKREHLNRVKRTLVGCFMGILTGVISYFVVGTQITGLTNYTMLALLLMLIGVVVQRHIFVLTGIGGKKMEKKDWLYQGFVTFAFWFISWTILLNTSLS
jgi:hypothetical protein